MDSFWTQPSGDVFHLGEMSRRDLYFAVNPLVHFFKMHGTQVSLVVGTSNVELPDAWSGQIAFFDELFYYHEKDNKIGISPNIHRRIVTRVSAGLRRGKNRVIHERRDFWLRFLVALFRKGYNPKVFFRGVIRRTVVRNWFVKNIPGAPTNPKTYKRDYEQFCTYCGQDGEHDFRELLNPDSLKVLNNCVVEPYLKEKKAGDFLQFQRIGYFTPDLDSTPDHLVFNKTVGLKDTWKRS